MKDSRPLYEGSDDEVKDAVNELIALIEADPDSALLADEDGVPELEGILLTLECAECDALVVDDDERDDTYDCVASCVGTPVDV